MVAYSLVHVSLGGETSVTPLSCLQLNGVIKKVLGRGQLSCVDPSKC